MRRVSAILGSHAVPRLEGHLSDWQHALGLRHDDLAAAKIPEFALRAEEFRGKALEVFRTRTDDHRTEIWHQLVMQTIGPRVHDTIKSKNWVLVRAPDEMLLTCDNRKAPAILALASCEGCDIGLRCLPSELLRQGYARRGIAAMDSAGAPAAVVSAPPPAYTGGSERKPVMGTRIEAPRY